MTGLEFRALRGGKMASGKGASMNRMFLTLVIEIVKIFKNFIKNLFLSIHNELEQQFKIFCQKRGTVIGLIDKVFLLSHPVFHYKNIKIVINILLNNDYPLDFILHTCFNRLKKLLFTSDTGINRLQNTDGNNSITYFTIPYVPSISERFKHIVKDLNVRLSYYPSKPQYIT